MPRHACEDDHQIDLRIPDGLFREARSHGHAEARGRVCGRPLAGCRDYFYVITIEAAQSGQMGIAGPVSSAHDSHPDPAHATYPVLGIKG